MTLQAVRVSFYCFNRLMASLKSFFVTSLVGLVVLAFITEFSAIREAVVDAVSSFRRMSSVEGLNIKVVFRSPEDAPAIPLLVSLDEPARDALFKDIRSMKPELFERLLNVGALPNLCEFEHPDAQMLEDLSLDHKLRDMGLVKLDTAPEVQASVTQEMRARKMAGDRWDIGKPLSCYVARLESRGWNVKTAILQYLSSGLSGAAALHPEGQAQPKPARVAHYASR